MLDITFIETSFWLNVYCMLFFIVLIIANYKRATHVGELNYVGEQNNLTYQLFVVGMFIMSLTAFTDSDYFSYQHIVHWYSFIPNTKQDLEPVYDFIVSLVNCNYLLFRTIVWGSAMWLLLRIFRNFDINPYLSLFVVFACYFHTFSYARSSLAMALFYFGFSEFYKHRRHLPIYVIILSLAVIIGSYSFHNSMLILIALLPISFLPLNKKILFTLLIVVPLSLTLMRLFFSTYLVEMVLNNPRLLRKLEDYQNLEREAQNWKGMIRYTLEYATFYIPIILLTYKLVICKGQDLVDVWVFRLFKLMFWITVVATMFAFLNFGNFVFFYRTLYMTFIPLSVLLVKSYQKEVISLRSLKYILSLGIFYQIFTYFYVVYTYS